jgi:hypothetical protein
VVVCSVGQLAPCYGNTCSFEKVHIFVFSSLLCVAIHHIMERPLRVLEFYAGIGKLS